MSLPEILNADYIESQHTVWKNDPDSVSKDWQYFFKGFEIASAGGMTGTIPLGKTLLSRQANVQRLIHGYRSLGHILACMDPLSDCPTEHPLLSLKAFELDTDDLDSYFHTTNFNDDGETKLKEILALLKEIYCRSIGVEYMHIRDPDECRWLRERMEPVRNRPMLEKTRKRAILRQLARAALFERFLNKKYLGVTRFSLEGSDAVIPLLNCVVTQAASHGCREIILGMAHRGRLNVQCHILEKPYEEIFKEFENCYDPGQLLGSGDVKYHNGYLADIQTDARRPIRLFLVSNPSHLEAVDPVVEGISRARQEIVGLGQESVLPVLIHGDAAFAGQGVVAETLNMSQLEGYKTGGTVHIIINNQIGYTTVPGDARSTRYSTDIAKMLMVPIFHVHGENPEAVVHVGKLAVDYRNRFRKDVVIDVICYRRYGHNEGDEPYFTQPRMYDRIKERPALYVLYAEKLQSEKIIDDTYIGGIEKEILEDLHKAYATVRETDCLFPQSKFFEKWDNFHGKYVFKGVKTGLAKKTLADLAKRLNTVPDNFSLNPKLKRLLGKRLASVKSGEGIDWANAEVLAFASLLMEGFPIRLSGQDVGRGTFSQRHSVLFDAKTGKPYIPLNHLSSGQALFQVYNSLLAEASVLGFEYGYTITQPDTLVLWEAQFGDFSNNAQSVIDLFIASGQSKWRRLSGLTLLLPHGWEGLGPEHSTARLERFLQLCAEDNMQVCNLTTPAQYFHLLRRQIKESYRKPLVLMTPKSLLRNPMAVSSLNELVSGRFQGVLGDPDPMPTAEEVIFCSGKIFYQLLQRRNRQNEQKKVILRLEQFYPFPGKQLETVLKKYPKVQTYNWVQEEPENMGGWGFVRHRLEKLVGKPLGYIGRKPSASPATGFPAIYKRRQEAISNEAIGPMPDYGN